MLTRPPRHVIRRCLHIDHDDGGNGRRGDAALVFDRRVDLVQHGDNQHEATHDGSANDECPSTTDSFDQEYDECETRDDLGHAEEAA